MLYLLGKNSRSIVLGLDVSSTTAKLLELSKSGGRYRVESYGVANLPLDAVIEKTINDIPALSKSIAQAAALSETSVTLVAAAVAGSTVITKLIEMPDGINDDALEATLFVEADQHIPYPLEEVALDFEVQGGSLDLEGYNSVLLAACRKETLDARVEAIEAAGLKPTIIDIEAFAIERAFELIQRHLKLDPNSTVAIFDIGATMTTLSVLHRGRSIYTREQVFGGKQLTDEIMGRYGLPLEEAGLAKKHGGLPDDYEPEVLEPFKEAVIQHISRSLQLFFSSSHYNDVDLIVLAGGVACMAGLDRLVREKLGTRVVIANPFQGMTMSSKVDAVALQDDAPGLMIACGLAMRSFD